MKGFRILRRFVARRWMWLPLAFGLSGCGESAPIFQTQVSAAVVPANGISSVSITAEALRGWSLNHLVAHFTKPNGTVSILEGEEFARLGPELHAEGRWRQDIIVGHQPGKVVLRLSMNARDGTEVSEHTVTLAPDNGDGDKDGFPNALELKTEEDRFAFRSWFTSVASSQAKAVDTDWHTVHQDCAGLLRFSYKEALRKHDNSWLERRRFLSRNTIRDVERYNYPDVPLVGTNIFKSGSSKRAFSASANAKTLRDHNTAYVGHDLSQAQNGDLLFYEYDGDFGRTVHSMILLIPTGHYQGDESAFVVYHTGPSRRMLSQPDGTGEVRRVSVADLHRHPDPLWHPRYDNRNFSGVYRWNILQ